MENKQKVAILAIGAAALSLLVYFLTKSEEASSVIVAFAMTGIPISSTPTVLSSEILTQLCP
ncbi:MAG: hypothetical protein R3Y51_07980, partial [Rikenellaceae bacterium]